MPRRKPMSDETRIGLAPTTSSASPLLKSRRSGRSTHPPSPAASSAPARSSSAKRGALALRTHWCDDSRFQREDLTMPKVKMKPPRPIRRRPKPSAKKPKPSKPKPQVWP